MGGNPMFGGCSTDVKDDISNDVCKVVCTVRGAMAAVKHCGSVSCWGNPKRGGDNSPVSEHLQSGVREVYATDEAFAAFKDDGLVVVWGDSDFGGKYELDESIAAH